MKRLTGVALCLAIALPALAAPPTDNLAKGIQLYKAGQYYKALGYFQDSVKKKPKVWQGHYYLANTYLTLGDRDQAYEQYRLCQACRPTPDIEAACEQIVSKLASASTTSMPSYNDPDANRSRNQYLIQQKQAILDDAGRQAQLNRDRTMNAILNETAVGNGGRASFAPDATAEDHERAMKIQRETEKKNEAIYEAARRRAREIK